MFGFLFGKKAIDEYRAQVIHTYLQTYHRVHESMGMDFLLGTIKSNPLTSDFADLGDSKSFRIKADIADFNFLIPTVKSEHAKPIVSVFGDGPYSGFNLMARLDTGSLILMMQSGSSARAMKLCDVFQAQYDAGRVS